MTEMTEPEAQAAYDAAVARFDAACAEVEASRYGVVVAKNDLENARVRADRALPQATIVQYDYRRVVPRRENVAIVRRTKARITVRRHGSKYEYLFRLSKAGGNGPAEWVISPPGMMKLEINE
jgi:hypothetical protein